MGGNSAQLNLNTSGLYYEIYYVHRVEMTAVGWSEPQPNTTTGDVQGSYAPNRYEFTSTNYPDIYPPLVRQSSWLILGYSTLEKGRATTSFDGDLVTYSYPIEFLHNNKNLIYDNGGAEIYK